MKKYFVLTFCLIALLCIGCDTPIPNTKMNSYMNNKKEEATHQIEYQSRININQIGIFRDELAYGYIRGIYIINDQKTGKEFIGISGIGISEIGSHIIGKTTIIDER